MVFDRAIEKYRNNTAILSDSGVSISYGQLNDIISAMGEKVREDCSEAKPLVFSFCRNLTGSLVGYVAFLENGIVPLMLSADIDEELKDRLLQIYKPDYVYKPEDMTEKNEKVIYSGYGYCLSRTEYSEKHDLYKDLALLITTSGSTGSPKLVRQSYENIRENALSIAEYLKIDEGERPITTLPMNYTYGLSILNSHLIMGATILLTEKNLMQREFWSFFKEKGATSFGGVPYTYEMLKKLRFLKMELPSLKTMTQSGGKLSLELYKEFAEYAKETGKEFVAMYGQTEATTRIAYLPPEKAMEKYVSIGKAIPGGKLYLEDESGNRINEADIVGELVYEGKNVTLGYGECIDDLKKGDERKGVLKTGDMAKMDDEGFFYIVGRKKRFLKLYGNRVNLDETEMLIKNRFAGLECACAGEDDRLGIFAVTDDTDEMSRIKKFAAEKTGINIAAFQVISVAEIPKNEAGKILYSKLSFK